MAVRAFFPAFFFALLAQAFAGDQIPEAFVSAKARDVIPVLAQISQKDSPQVVWDKIKKVLGETDFSEGGGPMDHFHFSSLYVLDDQTKVGVFR